MKRPCRDDLFDAAGFLADVHPDADSIDVYRRVAAWLEFTARESDDRSRARTLGCTVKYLRNVIDKEAHQ